MGVTAAGRCLAQVITDFHRQFVLTIDATAVTHLDPIREREDTPVRRLLQRLRRVFLTIAEIARKNAPEGMRRHHGAARLVDHFPQFFGSQNTGQIFV